MSRVAVETALRAFVDHEGAELALPGSGDTWSRFEILASWAQRDLSVGRLAEGHADALAILGEWGMGRHHFGAAYGVWAARSRGGDTIATPVAGGWRLSGRKEFCSGIGIIDRALVTAQAPDGYRLFDVAVDQQVVGRLTDSWPAIGMADSASETVDFGGPVISDADAIGGPGFYTNRPGFWFGSTGVAACWYGGAAGLVDHLIGTVAPEPGMHVLADLGRAVARVGSMREVLHAVAVAIDSDPFDKLALARFRALAARQVVHDSCLEVLSHTTAAGGARPLCHDPDQARRAADLFVYLAQHHGGVDAAEIGRLALGGQAWS